MEIKGSFPKQFSDIIKPKDPFIPDKKPCTNPKCNPPMGRYFPTSGNWFCPSCGKCTRIDGPLTF